ncbi:uncharacterized protein M421DRAFT_400502 [Didymella exigua CBS 183.55]|uniref:Uncharacterized protein n=1 Tax=Didymella exigua CBS 183.55 TaxID=1150837 RepID=A0A6A5RA43_9PLEO|nr:uncharacterized protein M421DRAFT_400502 [Didymella exigua CBS 183.55]KAF1925095.1 hypothetical protein M421DRAFT_400502 [Didymella exigua CBS 183.55]
MARLQRREQLHHRVPSQNRDFIRNFTTLLQPPDWRYKRDRYTYTYSFKPPRPQRDPVIRLIKRTIRDLMNGLEHGVAMCNANFRVFQTIDSPPIWPSNETRETKLYTFTQEYEEFPATVPISVKPHQGALDVSKIHVRISGEWVPIRQWLVNLAEKSKAMWERTPESIQYFWNKRNKRSFDLWRLPAELRRIVLQYAIAPEGEIYPLSELTKTCPCTWPPVPQCESACIFMGVGYTGGRTGHKLMNGEYATYRYEISTEVHARVYLPNTNLLLASKWLKQEALEAGWNGPVKCFVDNQNFVLAMCSRVGAAQQFNVLGRIELSFTMGGWLRFLGIDTPFDLPLHQVITEARGPYLAQLANTTRLSIRFRDPDDGWADHPWGQETQKTACQSVMIDWIMTFAFPHIKHIARLNLTGCIRNPQKQNWESLLERERTGVPHDFDQVATAEAVLATDVEYL